MYQLLAAMAQRSVAKISFQVVPVGGSLDTKNKYHVEYFSRVVETLMFNTVVPLSFWIHSLREIR